MQTRKELMDSLIEEGIKEAYLRAQPSVDISQVNWEEYEKDPLKEEYPFYDRYYLPMEIQSQILDDITLALNASNDMDVYGELILTYLEKGGHKEVYKPLIEGGNPCRSYEDTPKLEELIGKENTEKAFELIKECIKFYSSHYEENRIRSSVFQYPTSNAEKVKEYWEKMGRPIDIDDSVYKNHYGDWEYSAKEYINGKVTIEDDDEEFYENNSEDDSDFQEFIEEYKTKESSSDNTNSSEEKDIQ